MGFVKPEWSAIHKKKKHGIWTPFLMFFSFLYGIGVRIRMAGYSSGILKRNTLPGTVVSIGNMTAGGTGKTPATIMFARWAFEKGYRVGVLSRGYGGNHRSGILEVSDEHTVRASAAEAGDEPVLIAKSLPGIPVIVSRKRYDAGMYAHRKFNTDFFVLDDGFQHMSLERSLDLVLMDAALPLGNGYLLPRGPLREPVGWLSRADILIVTRSHDQDTESHEQVMLREKFPCKPVFKADHIPVSLELPGRSESLCPGYMKDKYVMAFAGLADPNVLKNTLLGLGAYVVGFRSYKDHYCFSEDEIADILTEADNLKAQYIVTTEKDWMRISHLDLDFSNLGYLRIRFGLLSDEETFFNTVERKLIDQE